MSRPAGRVVRGYSAICGVMLSETKLCPWFGQPYVNEADAERSLANHHREAHEPPVTYEVSQ